MNRIYWDSSALIAALSSDSIRSQLTKETAVTRVHSLAEVFSTLTGGRLGFRVSAGDASGQILELASSLELVPLGSEDVLNAFEAAEARGVRGGRIHDFLHAVAAGAAGAEKLITADRNDFTGLVDGLTIETITEQ